MANEFKMEDIISIPEDYIRIDQPKRKIALMIKEAKEEQSTNYRAIADKAGLKHSQIHRMLRKDNYTIDNLLKVLDALDIELTLQPRKNNHSSD